MKKPYANNMAVPNQNVRAVYLHLSKAIITHLVHEAVQQDGWAGRVHTELTLWSEVIWLLQSTIQHISLEEQARGRGAVRESASSLRSRRLARTRVRRARERRHARGSRHARESRRARESSARTRVRRARESSIHFFLPWLTSLARACYAG